MFIGMFSDRVRNKFLRIKSSKTKTDLVSVPRRVGSGARDTCSRFSYGRAAYISFCPFPLGLIRTLFEQTLTPPPVYSLFLSSVDIGWHDLDPDHTARYLCRRHTRTTLLYHLHTCTIRRAVYIYDTGYNIFVPPGPGEIRTWKKGACREWRGGGRRVGNIPRKCHRTGVVAAEGFIGEREGYVRRGIGGACAHGYCALKPWRT